MENNNEEIQKVMINLQTTNHGWLGMPWPYQDDYTIFLGTQRNFSQNMILKPWVAQRSHQEIHIGNKIDECPT
jgi:hypothetical protein